MNSPPKTTSGLTSFRQLKRFPENTAPSLEEHQIQHRNSRKAPCTPNHLEMRADSLASTQEVCQLSTSPSTGAFSQQQVCEGPGVCCLKWSGPREALTRKKAGFPCNGLNAGSCFISQDEGMSESPAVTLEKDLGPRLISKGGLPSL